MSLTARIPAPRRLGAAAVAAVALAALAPAGSPDRADAACLASLRLDGRLYIGQGVRPAAIVPGPGIGYAMQPPCIDTVPPVGPTEPTRMAVRRVAGVAPRVAVLASHGARGIVFVAADRCRAVRGEGLARERALLRCLRRFR